MSSSASPASNTARTPETSTTRAGTKACDSCSRRKIRCSLNGSAPPCDYCAHHGMSCTFDRPHRRRWTAKTTSSKQRIATLGERMERVERMLLERLERKSLAQTSRSDDLPRSMADVPGPQGANSLEKPSRARGRISFVSTNKQSIDLYHGVPFLSKGGQMWIRFTGEYALDGSLWQNQLHTSDAAEYSGLSRTLNLPPREEVLAMLHTIRPSDFMKVFPVIDFHLFHDTLAEAYEGNNYSARACISAFVAFALSCSQGFLDTANLERLKQTAYALIPGLLEAKPKLAVLDTLVIVTVLHYCCGALQTADVFLSVCARFLYMVDGHLGPREHYDDVASMRKAYHYRDLFWICWTFDAEISFRTGRPPAMNSTSCDLTLPAWYLQQSSIDGDQWRYPGDLRLSLIKAEAYQKLYSPAALRKSDAEILKDIRELDNMLETWRWSVSPQNRPPLAYTRETLTPLPTRFHWTILCLEYHHCIGTIHQASSRCKLWAGDKLVQQGVASSHDLSLQARRSILMYFHDIEERMLPHVFWIIVFFPLSAALTIFCNIVSSPPGDETAISDARLLAEAFHELSKRYEERKMLYPAAQEAHMRHLREFVEELVMLAKVIIKEGGESEEQKRLLQELSVA